MSERSFPSEVTYPGIDIYKQPDEIIAYSCIDDIKLAISFDNSLNENEVIAHVIKVLSKIFCNTKKPHDDEIKDIRSSLRNKK